MHGIPDADKAIAPVPGGHGRGRAGRLLAMLALLAAMAPGGSRGAEARGAPLKDRLAACSSCHGGHGEGGGHGLYPRLAGQSADYLLKQLEDYQAGRRRNRDMQRMVAGLPPAYLHSMADYYAGMRAALPAGTGTAGSRSQYALGEAIATRGKPQAGLPACAACHGADLMGSRRDTRGFLSPALLGQSAFYINMQLSAWKNRARDNDPLWVMQAVTARLSSDDMAAVAAYLAGTGPAAVVRSAQSYAELTGQGPAPASVRPDPAAADARGAYLVKVGGCAACHSASAEEPFAGGKAIDTPYGVIYSTNITPDPVTGIGTWSDADFYEAVHDGIAPGHRYLYPAFPFPSYTRLTRDDVLAIKTYLFAQRPIRRPDREPELRWPYRIRSALAVWRALYFRPQTYQDDVRHSARWNRGAYLVEGLGHCAECHAARNRLGATEDGAGLKGGSVQLWSAPGLLGTGAFGVQDWSEASLMSFLSSGRADGRTAAIGPMREVVRDSLQYLNDADLHAMAAYLRGGTGPNAEDTFADAAPPGPEALALGADVYRHQCSRCHQASGAGKTGSYPALRGNPVVLAEDPGNVLRMILDGGFMPATRDDPMPYSMPPFGTRLSDAQVAAVATYIRNHWDNAAPPVAPQSVSAAR